MKLKTLLFAILTLGLFTMTGCKTDTKDFEGSWTIYGFSINGTAQQIAVSEITFEQQTANQFSVTGNSGVNAFFGDVTINGSKIKPSQNFGSTKMAGSPEAMEYEDNFLKCLLGASKAKIRTEGGFEFLEITNSKDKSTLTFIRK